MASHTPTLNSETQSNSSASMEVFMSKTKALDGNIAEQTRLEYQHDTILHSMGGKALYAPVDLSKPGLRILDSGCANGRWIKDLQAASPAKHEYVGTDVVESLYPNPPPEGTQFQDQSIKEAFPESWQGSFDVVHQRLVMAAAAPEKTPTAVVQELANLVRPGGWLQMVEVIPSHIPNNPLSQNQYIDMLNVLYTSLYTQVGQQYSNLWACLPQEMETAGLKNVQKEEILVRFGAAVDDSSSIRHNSIEAALDGVKNFQAVLKRLPKEVWRPEWDNLEQRLRNDLEHTGGYMRYIVCWGQK
ncbi:Methyltransferase psoC [Cladobotryum mycophilum]|uniref:Methyltransferase psoC n=1 Tax=Cladobotryum mycophilum TaxID=491253 RepID=A0ABR0SIW7_9HYPO